MSAAVRSAVATPYLGAAAAPAPFAPTPAVTEPSAKGSIPLRERRIAVLVNKLQDGAGDLSAGFKIVEMLHRDVGVPKQNIVMFTDASEKDIESFNKEGWKVVKLEKSANHPYDKFKADLDKMGMQFLVVAPVLDNRKKVEKFAIPKVFISEYGFGGSEDSGYKSLGLGADDLGIFIDQNLRQRALRNLGRTARMEDLRSIPVPLRAAILGDAVAQEKHYESFCQHARLYAGYARSVDSRRAFVAGVAYKTFCLVKEKIDHVTVVIPGKKINERFSFSRDDQEDFRSLLKASKVNTVRYIHFSDFKAPPEVGTEVLEKSEKESDARTVTVITAAAHLPKEQFLDLIYAAEDETLSTGDQSFSEVISLRKRFIYEVCNHKQRFCNQFALKIKSTAGKPMADLFEKATTSGSDNSSYATEVYQHIGNFFAASEQDPQSWNRVVEKVCTEQDAKLHFAAYLESALAKDPLVGSGKRSYAELDPQPFEGNLSDPKWSSLPFDVPYVVPAGVDDGLSLSPNGTSSYQHFADSYFTIEDWGDGYLFTRKKKTT